MGSTRSDLIDLTLQLHQETERALLVSDSGEVDDRVWLPKSQIEFEKKPGGLVIVTAPEWLAIERRLV
jgi:hypothetical protein